MTGPKPLRSDARRNRERLLEVAGERGVRLWAPEPGRPTVIISFT